MELAQEGLQIGSRAEQVLQRFLLDAVHQGDEQFVGLVLVLDERILLALGAEADPFAERVHVVKVGLPLFVDGHQHHPAFLLVEHFGRQIEHPALVGFLDLGHEDGSDLVLGVRAAIELFLRDANRQGGVDPLNQVIVVGEGAIVIGDERLDLGGDGFINDFDNEVARAFGGQDFIAVAIDDLALFVHDIVEVQHALAPNVVALFDALLGGFHRLVEPRMLEGLAFLHAEAFHHGGHAVRRSEIAHQVVFEGDEELRAARVALAGATAAELAVDAAGFVALGADDEQAAGFRHALAEFDVGAAAGHVGGHGDGARLAGAGDDFGFLLVELGVEDGMRNFGPL